MVLDGQHPAIIRNAVATPGGCTIGGLLTMEDGKIRSTMVVSIDDSLLILGENYSGGYECSKWIGKDATMKVIAKVKWRKPLEAINCCVHQLCCPEMVILSSIAHNLTDISVQD